MSNKKEKSEFTAKMDRVSNEAALQIVNYLSSNVGYPGAMIWSLVKASAIILEVSKAAGEDDAALESLIYDVLKPAREEVKSLLDKLGKGCDGN